LSPTEVEHGDAYAELAIYASEGTRAGVYLPEIFNISPHRSLRALTTSLARDKAGLADVGPETVVEVAAVTEVVESADRSCALRLAGPVAELGGGDVLLAAEPAGRAACDWLARLQTDDGALPQRVTPRTGEAGAVDFVRGAMTAHALAAFGAAHRRDTPVATARRAVAWLLRVRDAWSSEPSRALLVGAYLGKTALAIGDTEAIVRATDDVLRALGAIGGERPVLAGSHALAFLRAVSPRRSEVADACISLEAALSERFRRTAEGASPASPASPASLAEWAELAVACPPGSPGARVVRDWLARQQLPSGAFPDTTATDFAYSRGTGKVFEVLAAADGAPTDVITRALRWLLSMQYRDDSVFFVPAEHRSRVLGGLRHDAFDADAWIDAAGHLLLGVARLAARA